MHVLHQLPKIEDDRLILGPEAGDDAGVYRLTDEVAIIQTVDFITPVVDDAYTFGQITVANSLSDVYAMGGKPVMALNVVGFPTGEMDLDILAQMLKGGIEKLKEAGVLLMGGHTVDDRELKYGLAVTGTVHPDRIVTNAGARPGDGLILTKPLGIGIMTTTIKAGKAEAQTVDKAIRAMVALNDEASEAMVAIGAHACTDITGFGLLGHACEMAESSQVAFRLYARKIPIFPEAVELAEAGLIPGGSKANQKFYSQHVTWDSCAPEELQPIFYDAQTSGGLLISVEREKAEELLDRLRQAGVRDAEIIGQVISEPPGMIVVS